MSDAVIKTFELDVDRQVYRELIAPDATDEERPSFWVFAAALAKVLVVKRGIAIYEGEQLVGPRRVTIAISDRRLDIIEAV